MTPGSYPYPSLYCTVNNFLKSHVSADGVGGSVRSGICEYLEKETIVVCCVLHYYIDILVFNDIWPHYN